MIYQLHCYISWARTWRENITRELLNQGTLRREGIRIYSANSWPQRLLWASTGVKDATAAATLYVKALAAPFTIDTMPELTLKALSEETELNAMMAADGSDCEEMLAAFTGAESISRLWPISYRRRGKAFAKSWDSLIAVIALKCGSAEKGTAALLNS